MDGSPTAAVSAHSDREYMESALALAQRAQAAGEVPVGAVVVLNGEIIGRGYNQPIGRCDPCAHAEILAIRDAAKTTRNYRLANADLYVTLEPCVMCAGAILQARIARLIFAARDEKSGAAGSALNLLEGPFLNHRCKVVAGVKAADAANLLREFFAARRAHIKDDTHDPVGTGRDLSS